MLVLCARRYFALVVVEHGDHGAKRGELVGLGGHPRPSAASPLFHARRKDFIERRGPPAQLFGDGRFGGNAEWFPCGVKLSSFSQPAIVEGSGKRKGLSGGGPCLEYGLSDLLAGVWPRIVPGPRRGARGLSSGLPVTAF